MNAFKPQRKFGDCRVYLGFQTLFELGKRELYARMSSIVET